MPTLSVVIPNYNHSKFLPHCIETIMAQSWLPDEVIVIDDCSTDNSVEVIQELAEKYPRLKLVRNEVNQGVSLTVNRGIQMAKGQYISSVGADDFVVPGLFEKSLQLLAKHPEAGLCGAITRFEDVKTGTTYLLGVDTAHEPCYLSPDEIVKRFRADKFVIFTSVAIFRRDALIEAGCYPSAMRWHSDWFAITIPALRYGVCFVPEVLGVFRVMPQGYSKKGMGKVKRQLEVLEAILKGLDDPAFKDVFQRVRDGAALASFGKEMLYLLLTQRRYWKYLNWAYLRIGLWWTVRIEVKKILPVSIVRLYMRLAGYSRPSQD